MLAAWTAVRSAEPTAVRWALSLAAALAEPKGAPKVGHLGKRLAVLSDGTSAAKRAAYLAA
jgi:hypothetical protein